MYETVVNGKYYHIYNRGINGCNIFKTQTDYEYFLVLYLKYISTVAETFAWCLLKNHFHVLLRIKEKDEIGYYKYTEKSFTYQQQTGKINRSISYDEVKWETIVDGVNESESTVKKRFPNPTNHFKHLFNSYAKYFNYTYNRHGALFERPFRRKLILQEKYFKNLVIYIHNNPVNHGFVNHPLEWGWSSYQGHFSDQPKQPFNSNTLSYFGDLPSFKAVHELNPDTSNIENMLGLK